MNVVYLLLVENNYISSREIKSLLDNNKIDCEIVNCSSSSALIEISDRLRPDIVIIDFDFHINDSAKIVKKLRQFNGALYIFAFVDPDHFEKLHPAIEMGIDDYMVKPLQREDMMLRIKMALRRKNSNTLKQGNNLKNDDIGNENRDKLSAENKKENKVLNIFARQKTPEKSKIIISELADDFNEQNNINKTESHIPDFTEEVNLTNSEYELKNTLIQEYDEVTDDQDLNSEHESYKNELEDLNEIDISYFNSSEIDETTTDETNDVEIIYDEEAVINEKTSVENDDNMLYSLNLDIEPEFQAAVQSDPSEEKLNPYSVDETFFSDFLDMQNEHEDNNYNYLKTEQPQPEEEITTLASESFVNEDESKYLTEDLKLFGVDKIKKTVDTRQFEELFDTSEGKNKVNRSGFSFLKSNAN